MGIVAILVSLAVPSFKYVTNANRVSAEVNGLLGDLQFARAEAVKEGKPVTICISNNASGCTAGSDWKVGWIIFTDANGNAAIDAGTDAILQKRAAFNSTDTFAANPNLAAITFNREGFAAGLANPTFITLHTSPANSASTRCVSVGMVGLSAVQRYDGANCL